MHLMSPYKLDLPNQVDSNYAIHLSDLDLMCYILIKKFNVSVYSLIFPLVQETVCTPCIGTLSYTVSSPWGKISAFVQIGAAI